MSDDYLWDRTGDPDPEVKELEDVLSTLRFKTQPFVLPDEETPKSGRKWLSVFAIAAAIAITALALGIWLRLDHQQAQERIAVTPGGPDQSVPSFTSKPAEPSSYPPSGASSLTPDKKVVPTPELVAISPRQKRRGVSQARQEVAELRRAEAESAKEQLMLALRVVSAKLSLAQRKTVPGNNNTRYQHKVG